jgi:hypothetical protein
MREPAPVAPACGELAGCATDARGAQHDDVHSSYADAPGPPVTTPFAFDDRSERIQVAHGCQGRGCGRVFALLPTLATRTAAGGSDG